MGNRAHTVYAVVWQDGLRFGLAAVDNSRSKAEKMREELVMRAISTRRHAARVELVAVPSGRLDRTFL